MLGGMTLQSASIAACVALVSVGGFLVLLALLHGLEPEFDPAWRWISEYELGRWGWLMRLAFGLWSAGALALLLALGGAGGLLGRAWLLLIVIALLGAGLFVTDPITAVTPTLAGRLHGLAGIFTILTFPIMATVLAASLAGSPQWAAARPQLLGFTLLTWVGQVAFWGTILVSSAIHHPAGLGPQVRAGWPNRFMVVTYALWLMALAWLAR